MYKTLQETEYATSVKKYECHHHHLWKEINAYLLNSQKKSEIRFLERE